MSQLGVTVTNGEPAVAAITDSGIATPPVFLYSHAQNYLKYLLAQDLTPWANADDTTFGVPIRSVSGPMIFNGTQVTIDPGRYAVVIDASAIGNLDAGFKGFNVEVSISANPPNDPSSQSSKIVTSTLLPKGNSTFTPKYVDGNNSVISSPIVSNATPAEFQSALNALDSLTGGITVLTAAGPHKSFVGGPYFVKFNNVGAKKLLRFNTTNGLTVGTARVLAGDGSTQEIQKIVLNRPLTVVALDISSNVLYDVSHTWTLQIYLTNPLTTATTVRRLAIHSLSLYKIASKLYEITAGDGVINTAPVVFGSGPSDTPGGFRVRVQQNAAVAYDHEARVFAFSELAGTTASNPKLPAAHLLTGTTTERPESLILRDNFQHANAPTPAPMPAVRARLLIDTGGNPPLTPVVSVFPLITQDDMESYTNGVSLDTLNGGIAWSDAYIDRNDMALSQDDMESYSDSANLDGLNGGINWADGYVDRNDSALANDDMESYADSANLDGLNGGTSWGAAYHDRATTNQVSNDDLESYTNGTSLDGLNGGTNWGDAFVSRP